MMGQATGQRAYRQRRGEREAEPVTDTEFEQQKQLHARLQSLESEHRDLDEVIERLADDKPFDQLKLQRLKKRKLVLKDEMTVIRSRILPDIIA